MVVAPSWVSKGLSEMTDQELISYWSMTYEERSAESDRVDRERKMEQERSSLPSISSPAGILMVVVSVVALVSLAFALIFVLKKFLRKVLKKQGVKREDEPQRENIPPSARENNTQQPRDAESAREIIPPQPIALVPEPSDSPELQAMQEETTKQFYEFMQDWNEQSLKGREEFIVNMIKDFPSSVSPSMVMDVLQMMLQKEDNTEIWIPMLRFTMMLERDLFNWDQTHMNHVPEGDKTIPSQTHQRFQEFLVTQAKEILRKFGDLARKGEDGQTGFMRFIAFLFGFVCKDKRILKLMDDTWTVVGFRQTDASRAVVWGYKRWMDNQRPRVRGRPPIVDSKGNHNMFHLLMSELRATHPVPRLEEGSRAQHLLFALGCGGEREWPEGPLEFMSDHNRYPETKYFYGVDYLWLMMGRDLMMGAAWQWMCKKQLSEHDRMCNRFGQEGKLYEHVVNTVMKYEADYCVEDGQCLMSFAARYAPEIVDKIDFGEHRAWYERYQQNKKSIGFGINAWLLKNDQQDLAPHVSKDPSNAVDYYTKVALQWEANKKNGGSQP